jgi:hypothetical protein
MNEEQFKASVERLDATGRDIEIPRFWRFPPRVWKAVEDCEEGHRRLVGQHQTERRLVTGLKEDGHTPDLWIAVWDTVTDTLVEAFDESFPCPPFCEPPGGP